MINPPVIAATPTYVAASGAIIMGGLGYAMNGVAVSLRRSAPSLAACLHAVQAKALAFPCASVSVSGKNAFRTNEHTTMAR